MGIQYSTSKVAVQHVVDAGISVIVNQMQDSFSTVSAHQGFDFNHCSHINISNVTEKEFLAVDFRVLLNQNAQADLSAKINDAVKAQAAAEAAGGLGLQGAAAESAISTLLNVSQHIEISAQSFFSQSTSLSQTITCVESSDITLNLIEMSQVANVVASAIVSQGSFTTAMEDIVSKIDGITTAKTKGYDPLAIMGLIAIVVIVAIIVLPMGGSLMGINMAKKTFASPYFWLVILGMISTLCAVGVTAGTMKFWPGQAIASLDSSDEVIHKKKINTAVTTISSVGLASALGAMGAVAYFALIRKKRT